MITFTNDLEEKPLIINKFIKEHNGGFWCLAVSENGQLLISGSMDTTVRVWDLNDQRQLACFTEHKGDVSSVALSKDCCLAISGSLDKTVILWDIRKHFLKNVFYGNSGIILSVAFTLDERMILAGGSF